jgi:hypothetical protein
MEGYKPMRTIVSKLVLASLIAATAALTPNLASAETTVKVPFDFKVQGKTMPAGIYVVQQDGFNNMVTLMDKDTSKAFSLILHPGDAVSGDRRISLKFEDQGDDHILRSVQYRSLTSAHLDNKVKTPAYSPSRLSQGR